MVDVCGVQMHGSGWEPYHCSEPSHPDEVEGRCYFHGEFEKEHEEFDRRLKEYMEKPSSRGNGMVRLNRFVGPSVLLRGVTAEDGVDFFKCRFTGPVRIEECHVGSIEFKGAEVGGGIMIRETSCGLLMVERCRIGGDLWIAGVKFSHKAYIFNDEIGGDLSIGRIESGGRMEVRESRCEGDAQLYQIDAKESFGFHRMYVGGQLTMSTISGEENNYNAIDAGEFYFEETHIGHYIRDWSVRQWGLFHNCRFTERFSFGGWSVSGTLKVHDCTFEGPMSFDHFSVDEEALAEFESCIFQGSVDSDRMSVEGRLLFLDCRLEQSVWIKSPTIGAQGLLSLEKSTFHAGATVEDLAFADRAKPTVGLDLSRVSVAPDATVRFLGVSSEKDHQNRVDMRYTSLLNTDVVRMKFKNARWGGGRGVPKGAIVDEWMIRCHPRGENDSEVRLVSPGAVAEIYRGIRKSYEVDLAYQEAGSFHVREMEMRRLEMDQRHRISADKHTGALRAVLLVFAASRRNLSVLGFYRWLGRYGESVWRPLAWLAAWMVTFGAFLRHLRPAWFPEPLGWFHKVVNEGIRIMPGQVAGTSVTELVGRSGATLLVALFIIALRRKLRR